MKLLLRQNVRDAGVIPGRDRKDFFQSGLHSFSDRGKLAFGKCALVDMNFRDWQGLSPFTLQMQAQRP